CPSSHTTRPRPARRGPACTPWHSERPAASFDRHRRPPACAAPSAPPRRGYEPHALRRDAPPWRAPCELPPEAQSAQFSKNRLDGEWFECSAWRPPVCFLRGYERVPIHIRREVGLRRVGKSRC